MQKVQNHDWEAQKSGLGGWGRGLIPVWTVCAVFRPPTRPVLLLQLPGPPSACPLSGHYVVSVHLSRTLPFSCIQQGSWELLLMVAAVAHLFPRGSTFIHLHAHLAQGSSLADTAVGCHPVGRVALFILGHCSLPFGIIFSVREHNLWWSSIPQTTFFHRIFSFFVSNVLYIYIHIYNAFNGQNKAITLLNDTLLWAGVGRVLLTNRVRILVVVVSSSMPLWKGPHSCSHFLG